MITNIIKRFIVLCLVTTALMSCESPANEDLMPAQSAAPTQVMTVLGKKLPNPHAPGVVRQAFENVKNSNPEIMQHVTMDFNPTHVYVKFFPKDHDELAVLEQMYGFELDNIPAFYEFETLGDYYHDPAISKNSPTYQYATLAVDVKLPSNVHYEILEQLRLLDESEQINVTFKNGENLMILLQREQYKLTGLTELPYGGVDLQNANVFEMKGILWRPNGDVRENFWRGGSTPMSGIFVRMHDIVYIPLINTGMTTGNDGKFRCDRRIAVEARYRVRFSSTESFTSNLRNGSRLYIARNEWYDVGDRRRYSFN